MLKVALVTYETSPNRGSEAAVSWNYITQMSEKIELHVIYSDYEEEIRAFIQTSPIKNVTWHHIPRQTLNDCSGISGNIRFSLNYRKWHKDVFHRVRTLFENKEIDICHFLNPIGFKEPGECWKIEGLPYVWGPIQGVDNFPLSLCYGIGAKTWIKALLRRVVHNSLFIFLPNVRSAIRRSDIIFGATPATIAGIRKYHKRDVEYLAEHSITEVERNSPITYQNSEILRLIWVGAVCERKALKIALSALSKVKSRNWHLDILGDGPELDRNKRCFRSLSDNVTFHGKVSREKVHEFFFNAHLHLITSLGEASTTVIFEAMSKGIPVLSLDHCGMSAILSHNNGIRVPLGNFKSVTDSIAKEIDDIIESPQKIRTLSSGALAWAKQHTWDRRRELFLRTYHDIVND
ncbi:MAG: glycosyltransferase family 4 protein [Paramuribaculum sp.]|nr:glycosyltransferase family 4 protein [Paramuribaculum sp.]